MLSEVFTVRVNAGLKSLTLLTILLLCLNLVVLT